MFGYFVVKRKILRAIKLILPMILGMGLRLYKFSVVLIIVFLLMRKDNCMVREIIMQMYWVISSFQL